MKRGKVDLMQRGKIDLMQRHKERGLLPSVENYMLLREVFHSGKTHACVKGGGLEYGKEK